MGALACQKHRSVCASKNDSTLARVRAITKKINQMDDFFYALSVVRAHNASMSCNLPIKPAVQQFKREAEMADPVLRWMRRAGLVIKPEFSLPWGVCDFVGLTLDPEKVRRRISYGQTRSIGSAIRLYILSKIPDWETGKAISFRKLHQEFSFDISPSVLSREIDVLIRSKFVSNPRKGFLQKVNGWAPLHQRIVAVENKLSRLSEAVTQATANRSFATESYVALPGALATKIAATSRKDIFMQRGIGLLAVYRHRCCEMIRPDKMRITPNEILQAHIVERFWRTRGN
jgi:hypothetical protein